MAEKEQQSPTPLAPAAYYGRSWSEAEAADSSATAQRKSNKRRKCFLYAFLFAVFQTGIILVFTFTVMKIRTPKLLVQSAKSSNVGAPGNTSLRLAVSAELSVKNSNFGRFKFEKTPVYFYYNGAQVAVAEAAKGKANWRSTTKLAVAVEVDVSNSVGVVALWSRAEMRGNVRVAMLIKKKRSAYLNCSMEIVTQAQLLRNIVCY